MRSLAIAVAAGLLLSGCATQDGDWTKLVQVTRYSSDTANIAVRGNSFASDQGVETGAMRAAARATLSSGFVYFAVVDSENRSRFLRYTTPGTATTTTYGTVYGSGSTSYSQTTLYPARTHSFYKPGIGMSIKMFATPPDGIQTFKAEEVLALTAPKSR
jgi:secreted trypsin-like serine protease